MSLQKLGIDYFLIEKFGIDLSNRHYAEMFNLSWLELICSTQQHFERVYEK